MQIKNPSVSTTKHIREAMKVKPGGLCIVKYFPDGTREFLTASSKLWEIIDLTIDEIKSCKGPTYLRVLPEDLVELRHKVRGALQTLSEWSHEFRIFRRDGKIVDLQGFGHCHPEPDGSILMFGVLVDVTDRNESRRQILSELDLEKQIVSLTQHSPAGHACVEVYEDRSSRLKYANQLFFDLMEVTEEEVLEDASFISKNIYSDDRSRFECNFMIGLQSNTSWQAEYRIVKPDGKIRWVESRHRPEVTKDGSVHWFTMVVDVSARKQTESLLREKLEMEKQFSRMVDLTPGAHYTIRTLPDGSAKLIYASSKFGALIDLDIEALRKDANLMSGRIHPLDSPRFQKASLKALKDGTSWHEEFRYRRRDDREVWLEIFCHPVMEEDGSVLWFGLLTEIGERKLAETTLREKLALEDYLRRIVQLSPGGIYVIQSFHDGSAKLIYASPKFLEINGMTMDELKDISALYAGIHPDDQERFKSNHRQALAKLTDWHEEFRFIQPNGNEIWLEGNGKHVRQDDGSVLRFGIVMDITSRKNLEKARKMSIIRLQENEARYKALAASIKSAIAIVSYDGILIYVNESCAEAFGRTKGEMTGHTWMEITQPDVWLERMKVIRRVIDENIMCEDEVKLIVKGESRVYHRIFRPITVHGKSDEVIVFATDITHSIPKA